MKRLLTLLLLLMIAAGILNAAVAKMSDDAAKAKAITVWGAHASTSKFWSSGQTGQWIMQIGCYDPANGFLVAGQGISWEAAFAAVDPKKNGPWKITATAKQSDGQQTTSPPITIYACNVELKAPTVN